jgi:hypothetical protein
MHTPTALYKGYYYWVLAPSVFDVDRAGFALWALLDRVTIRG